ncbi:Hypothetical protein PACV_431 [Pacmanvirus A23]|uniref:Hypothetical protein n=1 Tax=Pacmanvirus A23 TaxID=1932881 RepID=UPI000A0951E8|nr:Hypothetical protein B9W72_gp427 [Pacmanvirus A23]SIP86144.1 Hypothetical protein PACV_431 [Pacmanvirus A23]
MEQNQINMAFSEHKVQFAASLNEIRSISYEITSPFNGTGFIFDHPDDPTVNAFTMECGVKVNHYILVSVRQYKNKASSYKLSIKMVCDDFITNRINMVKFTVKTMYYEYVNNLNILPEYRTKINDCDYKYNMVSTDRCGLSYGDFIIFKKDGIKKRLNFDIILCYQNKFAKEEYYTIYYCPISSPF